METVIDSKWNETDPITVSVLVLCFNHAKFIRQSLDSILNQRVSFRIEIIVHDDASSDGSSDILVEYGQQYPDVFHLILQKENQYKKGIKPWFQHMMPKARGKYMAICDGDDFWTSPDKLQQQVDFLDANPLYTLTASAYKTVDDKSGAEEVIIREIPWSESQDKDGFDITIKRWLEQWLTKSVTLVFRTDAFNGKLLYAYENPRDTHLIYTLLAQGKGYYFKKVLGAYRIHSGGVFSSIGAQNQLVDNYYVYKGLHMHHPDDFSEKLFQWIVRMLKVDKIDVKKFPSRKTLFWQAFSLADSEGKMHELYKLTGWNAPRCYSLMIKTFKAIGKIK